MEDVFKLLTGSQAQYDAIQVKDNNALYFIVDTHRIYKGDVLFASGLVENLEQINDIEFYGGSATVGLRQDGE